MTIYLLNSDARHIPLADQSVQCVVTSPPYWGLRDYGVAGQIGLERTPQEYVASIVQVMREVWRVLRDDGVLWLNLGDSYAGSWGNYHPNSPAGKHGQRLKNTARWNRPAYESQEFLPPTSNKLDGLKPKDLVGIPWRVAFALQDAGWYLRSDIIWSKPNPMPESVTDRPTKAHEYIFLLAKSERYYYDSEAIKEPATCDRMRGPALHRDKVSTNGNSGLSRRPLEATRNRRSVWEVTTTPYSGAHFATFPPALVEPMVLAGTSPQACEHCGAPWARVTDNGLTAHDGETESAYAEGTTANRLAKLRQAARERGEEYTNAKTTIGWKPTCSCENNTGAGRCMVLDPFSGTATVGRVSAKHGRRFVGLDLNPSYIELAQHRTSKVQIAFQL